MKTKCLVLILLISCMVLMIGCRDDDKVNVGAKFVINNEVIHTPTEGLWVEVSLKENNNTVIIREGAEIKREMVCSGGSEETPTITGEYKLQNRGLWFYSERFKEGATYWVRIKDQFLFHGIPRDKEWNIIKDELNKLGQAVSHGCVRLEDSDAKWFYDNVPDGTTVIIHY